MKSLTIGWFLEVHIGIAERTTCDYVSTDANGQDAAGLVELFEEHRFVHLLVKVADIEGCNGVVGPARRHQHGHLESLFLKGSW